MLYIFSVLSHLVITTTCKEKFLLHFTEGKIKAHEGDSKVMKAQALEPVSLTLNLEFLLK